MRVGVFTPSFPHTSETFVLDQIVGLIDAGHEVEIVTLTGSGENCAHSAISAYGLAKSQTNLMAEGPGAKGNVINGMLRLLRYAPSSLGHVARVLRADRKKGMRMASVCAAMGMLAQGGPRHYDVIQVHFGPMGIVVDALREAGLVTGPMVVTFHGYDVNVFPKQNRGVYHRLFQRGEAFTANSLFLRGRLIDLGAPEDRTHLLPVGVDLERFRPSMQRSRAEPQVLTVARLTEVKGVEYALRAVAQLHRDGFNFHYTVVGDGPLRAPLERLRDGLGLTNAVTFAGALPADRVAEYLGQSHVFLFTGVPASDGAVEAQGRVLLEAQAAGLPVIATRVGGVPEVLAEGGGVLLPPGKVNNIADALADMLAKPGEWREMGKAGRSFVERRYDQDVLFSRLEDIYRSIRRAA